MTTDKQYPRFRLIARIEHHLLMVSFTVLALTGLPQMYASNSVARVLIHLLGGIEIVRVIHRWAAFALVLSSIYHIFTSTYRGFVREEKMRMKPTQKDFQDFVHTIQHNLGFREDAPKMPKFNFGEKVEYWAVVWGTTIMVITGFMLWNPIATASILPGQIIPAALAAHGGEALLAVLSILIWHMYNVHIKHFNPSIFTGDLPHHQMLEEHALELERLEAGGDLYPGDDLEEEPRRRRIFWVASFVVGIVLIGVLVWAFTFEQTAITTIPRITPEILPLVTPSP